MSKVKSTLPIDVSSLARWLALDPKAHLKELEGSLQKASQEEFLRLAEQTRIALKWAWDEQPELFFPLLSPWLKSPNAKLRRVASGSLPLAHEDFREKCIRVLKKLIVDPDPDVRTTAIDHLAENVNEHLELVLRWVHDEEAPVRALVARHLQYVDPERIKELSPVFQSLVLDPDPEVHWTAASTLLELYDREPRPVLEVMRQMANADDEPVRAAAAACFFEHVFADHFDQLLPTVRSWLRAGDEWLRWTLVRSLRFIRVTPRSLQLLRALYEDKEPEIRRRLILALLDMIDQGQESRRSLGELLRRAGQDPAKRVRDVIEEAEAIHGGPLDRPAPGEVEEPEE